MVYWKKFFDGDNNIEHEKRNRDQCFWKYFFPVSFRIAMGLIAFAFYLLSSQA
jgi:hypothetical protein